VVDPAGGSWYVERRTEDLAGVAWDALAAAEAAGGIAAALADGSVHTALAATLTERKRQLATRRRPLTGLSEFPDIDEVPPPPLEEPAVPVDAAFEPLRLHRLAEDFERQRGRADAHADAAGARPQVVLATLGPPAVFTARATFAKNLFEAGGIRTVAADVAAYDPAVSPIACLCSSDAVYGERGADAAAALRAAGAGTVYVAGRNLGLAGVDEEIGVGSDVLEVLTRALDRLGVPAAPGAAISRESS
jgi:methylmalonyl-CoA mutase